MPKKFYNKNLKLELQIWFTFMTIPKKSEPKLVCQLWVRIERLIWLFLLLDVGALGRGALPYIQMGPKEKRKGLNPFFFSMIE